MTQLRECIPTLQFILERFWISKPSSNLFWNVCESQNLPLTFFGTIVNRKSFLQLFLERLWIAKPSSNFFWNDCESQKLPPTFFGTIVNRKTFLQLILERLWIVKPSSNFFWSIMFGVGKYLKCDSPSFKKRTSGWVWVIKLQIIFCRLLAK